MPARRFILPLTAVALMACEREERIAAPTNAEAARLDEADRMLDTMAERDEPADVANPDDYRHRADGNRED